MCDYSITAKNKIEAAIGQNVVSTKFQNNAGSTGFGLNGGDVSTAVCMLPGTEVAFDKDVVVGEQNYGRMARFRQLNLDQAHTHHDVLEFADGRRVYVANLPVGLTGTVLQLPTSAEMQRRVDFQETQFRTAAPAQTQQTQERRGILAAVGNMLGR